MMKRIDDFYNKVLAELDKKYFPDVKYYRDDKNCADLHYTVELFNNGCLRYDNFIKMVCKICKDTEENIDSIIDKYLEDE